MEIFTTIHHKVSGSFNLRMMLPRITKFYKYIHIDLYSHTSYSSRLERNGVTSVNQHIATMKQQWGKTHTDMSVVSDRMMRTYSHRRDLILSGTKLTDILDMYPALQSQAQVYTPPVCSFWVLRGFLSAVSFMCGTSLFFVLLWL